MTRLKACEVLVRKCIHYLDPFSQGSACHDQDLLTLLGSSVDSP